MHININNKILSVGDYKVKCAIGKRGIRVKKREGDLITPIGSFKIKYLLYRKDRVSNIKTKIKKIYIKKNMGWCDDPKSSEYNKIVKLPFFYKTEKLHKSDNTYDIILVLDYNMSPVKNNKGSAIFIHIAKKNYKKTAGCVAIKKRDMKIIINKITKKTLVKIY